MKRLKICRASFDRQFEQRTVLIKDKAYAVNLVWKLLRGTTVTVDLAGAYGLRSVRESVTTSDRLSGAKQFVGLQLSMTLSRAQCGS